MSYQIDLTDGILTFTIDREEKRNAVNDEVMNGLKQVIKYIKENEDVRFLVVTGEGEKAFCSGGDLSEFHSLKTAEEAFGMLSKMGNILYELATLHVPTIALINGTAVGGGCEIATACDFRLVASHAKCGFIQGTLAITTGWGGGTYLFERGLRHDRALKMLIDAKPYDAQTLYDIGWAMRVFDGPKEEALEAFIEDMKKIHPSVHRAYKEIELRKWRERNVYGRVMEEIKLCAKLWESEEHEKAVERFLSKSSSKK
ncbi:enoyl-CoA hydratase/isomerase family protein [Ureibacillus sp. FSL K6-8385]|uniref:Ethylmalonyl-CoA decarboxylase n=1 Tax=Ureibacillus terrenus TaxID=118246 RepID=A0A540V457_9BACL|nr:enoyl-CoA hydratase/isomerase family protein [Ureibacillus terrenus]MED3660303.1 enoyl-CoA hydratase/isomerase family protein [Ureibacillus terrenus]MED3762459.1 enoyl-CoA hydratase/isomerase family protein [Ureibacillus terrenus]TQE91530.1 enoyl-CoA hydratase/isomerase family protein [Ureibacillus terrenus]